MFKWRDYEENTALFIDGVSTNVAILRYKDFQLTDSCTGIKVKMKSSCVEEAKIDAQNYLIVYWKRVRDDLNRNLKALKWLSQ